MPESTVFDIIFVGGGTTACIVAGRLTAADPSLKILILESGQHTRDVPSHVQPYRYSQHLLPTSTTVSFNIGKPSAYLNGRAPIVPCGRSVGGGSAVNFMVYTRGAASDYDDWAALGNKGWSFNELLPFIKKIETFTPIAGRPTHGYSGPVQISTSTTNLAIGDQLLNVGKLYDPGRPQADDNNDFKTPNAYSSSCRYMDSMTGKRNDAASRYLYPRSDNPNLKILTGKRVKRVVIENGRAVGVEYTSDMISDPEGSKELTTVKAAKLVVVSSGAFGSPTVLERSGIGAPSILQNNHIDVLVNLPGVGEHYQDHCGIFPVYHASDETNTMDDVWSDPKAVAAWLEKWERNGTGKIAHNGIETIVKFRPTAKELASSGPALQSRWETFFKNSPDKSMAIIGTISGQAPYPLDRSTFVGNKFFCVAHFILYPELLGSVHVTSGEDANAPINFDPDYCSKQGDVDQMILLYKVTRELARRMPAYRGEVACGHPQFPTGSPATCKEAEGPVPIDAPDIVYSKADDEAIDKYLRDGMTSTWHSLGTCSMKPREQGGVVDARLNVYGVEGLKVADMSICPDNVGNNTYSTALVIGEKAAAIIAEDLGIELV